MTSSALTIPFLAAVLGAAVVAAETPQSRRLQYGSLLDIESAPEGAAKGLIRFGALERLHVVAADVDKDGMVDAIVSSRLGDRGILEVLWGNAAFRYPNYHPTGDPNPFAEKSLAVELPAAFSGIEVGEYELGGSLEVLLTSPGRSDYSIVSFQTNRQIQSIERNLLPGPLVAVESGAWGQPTGRTRAALAYQRPDLTFAVIALNESRREAYSEAFQLPARPVAMTFVGINELHPELVLGDANGLYAIAQPTGTPMRSLVHPKSATGAAWLSADRDRSGARALLMTDATGQQFRFARGNWEQLTKLPKSLLEGQVFRANISAGRGLDWVGVADGQLWWSGPDVFSAIRIRSGVVSVAAARINADPLDDLLVLTPDGVKVLISQPDKIIVVRSSETGSLAAGEGGFSICQAFPCGDCTGGVCTDCAPCTLEAAISLANRTPELDRITFAVEDGGTQISAIRRIEESLVIDGTTQPGFAGQPVLSTSLSAGLSNDGFGELMISGLGGGAGVIAVDTVVFEGNSPTALQLTDVIDATIGGLDDSATNFFISGQGGTLPTAALQVDNVSGEIINNRFGLLPGDVPLPPLRDSGAIRLTHRPDTDLTIGPGNVVGPHDFAGIALIGDPGAVLAGGVTRIIGNRIGNAPALDTPLNPDSTGILLQRTVLDSEIIIGLPGEENRNIISGNRTGIDIGIIGLQRVRIENNIIGADESGARPLPNSQYGILVAPVSSNDRPPRLVGGTTAEQSNIIAFNGLDGVNVRPSLTTVLGNSIHSNGGRGIKWDSGCCTELPRPRLTRIVDNAGDMVLEGLISRRGADSELIRVEAFFSSACDDSGFGEGERFVGSVEFPRDAQMPNDVPFDITLTDLEANDVGVLTATVSIPGEVQLSSASFNTSEFSECLYFPAAPLVIAAGKAVPPEPPPGALDQTVLRLQLAATSELSATVTSIDATASGLGDDSTLSNIRLVVDENRDGRLDAGDTELATSQIATDNGVANFAGFSRTIDSGTNQQWLVVADLAADACPCEDFVFSVAPEDVVGTIDGGGQLTGVVGEAISPSLRIAPGQLMLADGDAQMGLVTTQSENPLGVMVSDFFPDCGQIEFAVVDTPDGAVGQTFTGGDPVLAAIDPQGRAEADLVFGDLAGIYEVEARFRPDLPGDCPIVFPEQQVVFSAEAIGLELSDTRGAYRPAERRSRTFVQSIEAMDTFTARVDPPTPGFILEQVDFALAGQMVSDAGFPFSATLDLANVAVNDNLRITATVSGEMATVDFPVVAIPFPEWGTVLPAISENFDFSFDETQRRYQFGYSYPTDFFFSETVDSAVALLGGAETDMGDEGVEFAVDGFYDLDSNSGFTGNAMWTARIFDREVAFEGNMAVAFDPMLIPINTEQPVGSLQARTTVTLPEKGFTRTVLIFGVPVSLAIDLGGELGVVATGQAFINSDFRLRQLTVSPEVELALALEASASAAAGLLKLGIRGEPTATAQIHLPYATSGGLQSPTFGGRLEARLAAFGSVFWGLGSGELATTTLGPYTFGDFNGAKFGYPDRRKGAANREFFNTHAIAGRDNGDVLVVFVADVGDTEHNPEVFFRERVAGVWGTAQPISGSPPNLRWELDPDVVYLSSGDALAVWTSNKADQSTSELNAILAGQELAWARRDGMTGVWSPEADLTNDGRADGTVALAFDASTDTAFAVWAHDGDASDFVLADHEIHAALFDAATSLWTVPEPLSSDGAYDFGPAIAAADGRAMAIWSEDGDGDLFVDPALNPDEDGTIIDGSNLDPSNTDARIVFSEYDGVNWSAKATLHQPAATAAYVQMADIAAASGGRYVAVWIEKNGTRDRLMSATFGGGSWSAASEVLSSDQFIEMPKVSVEGDTAHIVYRGFGQGDDAQGYGGDLMSTTIALVAGAKGNTPVLLTDDGDAEMFHDSAIAAGVVEVSFSALRSGSARPTEGFAGNVGSFTTAANPSSVEPGCMITLIDADMDEVPERVDVDLDLDIQVAGDYQLAARVDDSAGAIVTTANALATGLVVGPATVTLTLPAAPFANRSGSFALRDVSLSHLAPAPVVIDQQASQCDLAITVDAAAGAVRFSQAAYQLRETVVVSVSDSPGQTLTVRVFSIEDPGGRVLALVEDDQAPGQYRATLRVTTDEQQAGPDTLLVTVGTVIEARYNGAGPIDLATAQAAIVENVVLPEVAFVDGFEGPPANR